MKNIIDWLEHHFLACPYKKYFDIDCMGCGMQRSFIALLKGNFMESFYFYPALLPIVLMMLFLLIHLIFKFKNGASMLKYLFIFNISIVIISYLIKILR
ncbi:MAG: hypothetical protein A3K10_14720 [Bacteroidetes bacterium RIFCSPLOWO2_12_FULL_31_6]|nr:MAG: hypothetical protein A3K10_14720 [Bacteroidetes bacterium RIFCSPLOWO2_12_FULL_31_6]